MNKLLFVSSILAGGVLLSSQVRAYEAKGNPDRFISIGINSTEDNLSGFNNNLVNPGPSAIEQNQSQNETYRAYGIDVRIPLNPFLTMSVGYDTLRLRSEILRVDNSLQNHSVLTGDRVTIGLRAYLFK